MEPIGEDEQGEDNGGVDTDDDDEGCDGEHGKASE